MDFWLHQSDCDTAEMFPRVIDMRIFLGLAIFGLSCWIGNSLGRISEQTIGPLVQNSLTQNLLTKQPDIVNPNPSLTPEEVVGLQVDALQRFSQDLTAIEQCFILASLSNRAVTGPLDRFSAMVLSPNYEALVTGSHALVGKPTIRGKHASVLVTVLNEGKTPVLFRFFLSKQVDLVHKDCWMTDAVIAIEAHVPPDPFATS